MNKNNYEIVFLRITGERACFSNPISFPNKTSYDAITPSAARGVFSAIYWKPAIIWSIDAIHIINQIKRGTYTVNGLKKKVKSAPYFIDENKTRIKMSILEDVDYIVEAHIEITPKKYIGASYDNNVKKHYEIFKRRAKEGKSHKLPYLGCQPFHAQFEYIEKEDIPISYYNGIEVDMGYMLWDRDYSSPHKTPLFFPAIMKNGIIKVENHMVANPIKYLYSRNFKEK